MNMTQGMLMCRLNALVLLSLCLLLCVTSAFAQTENGLFTDSAGTLAFDAKPDPTVVRSRHVLINFDKLYGMDLPQGADSVILNLFTDVTFTAIKGRFEKRTATGYTWFGTILDTIHSYAIIVVEDGIMSANIVSNGKIYQIRFTGNAVHAIREMDQSKFPDESPPMPVSSKDLSVYKASAQPDSGSTIDIMVVYTAAALSGAGGTTAMNTLIQLAIDETNQSYANSGITQRVRLVHGAEVSYTESGTFCGTVSSDLTRLKETSDGYLDNVHSLRDTYGADLVSLFVETGDSCGCAYVMSSVTTAFAPYGFSVVMRSCATGYYSFGHEMGHNMGANHDWYVNSSSFPYAYAHGYVYTTDRWRTIMAYNTLCTDSGFNCTRLQYWSNPDVTYGVVPMGIPEGSPDAADNRKALNNTAYTVANFRQSVGVSCSGDVVNLQNVTFLSGQTYNCVATTSITAGTGVTVQSGATVNFTAPIINLQPGFTVESGAVFNAGQ